MDLLAGCGRLRAAVEAADREALEAWIEGWQADEAAFAEEVTERGVLLGC